MGTLLVTLIALGTLAFGAVYSWGYYPLFAAAALIGAAGLRGGVPRDRRALALALLLAWGLSAAQLVPLPLPFLERLSPSTIGVASSIDLTWSGAATERAPLSVDPVRTQVAVMAFGALALYLLGLPALLDGAALRSLPRLVAAFAVPLALLAIYTREHNNNLIYGFWQPLDGSGSNQAGPFVNRNHFGGWMLLAICLMLGWLIGQIERALSPSTARSRRRPLWWIASEDVGSVVLMVTAVAVSTISLFWVISRSAILSFGVALGIFAWLVVGRHRSGARRTLVLVTLGLVLLAGVAWRGPDVLIAWFLDERSLLSRLDAWRDGWTVVREFPLFGTGLNTYSAAMVFYQTRNPGWHLAQAHNDYLQLLAEGGTMLTAAAAIAAVLLVRAIRRSLRASRGEARGYWIRAGAAVGLVAVALQELVEFSLQIPAITLFFCTVAAVALSPARAPGGRGPASSRDNISQDTSRAPLS